MLLLKGETKIRYLAVLKSDFRSPKVLIGILIIITLEINLLKQVWKMPISYLGQTESDRPATSGGERKQHMSLISQNFGIQESRLSLVHLIIFSYVQYQWTVNEIILHVNTNDQSCFVFIKIYVLHKA